MTTDLSRKYKQFSTKVLKATHAALVSAHPSSEDAPLMKEVADEITTVLKDRDRPIVLLNHVLGIRVVLDPTQVFPEPRQGEGTPRLIDLIERGFRRGDYRIRDNVTWQCGIETGGTCSESFTEQQMKWLESVTPRVEAWSEEHGV